MLYTTCLHYHREKDYYAFNCKKYVSSRLYVIELSITETSLQNTIAVTNIMINSTNLNMNINTNSQNSNSSISLLSNNIIIVHLTSSTNINREIIDMTSGRYTLLSISPISV